MYMCVCICMYVCVCVCEYVYVYDMRYWQRRKVQTRQYTHKQTQSRRTRPPNALLVIRAKYIQCLRVVLPHWPL